jgi:anthranilate synthase component 2
MKILVIDNYDSFVFNLVQYIRELSEGEIKIVKNDQVSLEDIEAYDKILLSPGPGIPDEAGLLKEIIKTYSASKSILGVCLGHQAIAEVFGCKLKILDTPLHGVQSRIQIVQSDALFNNIPDSFNIGHYHSWVVDTAISDQIEVTSVDENGEIMSIRHKEHNVRGVQFHPESILTEFGKEMIANWLGVNSKMKIEGDHQYEMSSSEKSMLNFLMENETMTK